MDNEITRMGYSDLLRKAEQKKTESEKDTTVGPPHEEDQTVAGIIATIKRISGPSFKQWGSGVDVAHACLAARVLSLEARAEKAEDSARSWAEGFSRCKSEIAKLEAELTKAESEALAKEIAHTAELGALRNKLKTSGEAVECSTRNLQLDIADATATRLTSARNALERIIMGANGQTAHRGMSWEQAERIAEDGLSGSYSPGIKEYDARAEARGAARAIREAAGIYIGTYCGIAEKHKSPCFGEWLKAKSEDLDRESEKP